MATAVWPASLPPPRTASLRERLPDLTVRTPMSVGPDKVRRRASVGTRQFDVELDLTAAEFDTLRVFYLDTLEGGALEFEWIDHRTGDPTEYRFLGPPQANPRMPRKADHSEPWRASFSIEEIPAAAGDPGGGGGDDPYAPGLFDTLIVSGVPGAAGGAGGGVQLMPIPDEADSPEPVFLFDAIQVVIPVAESVGMGADLQALAMAGTDQHGQFVAGIPGELIIT